MKRIDALEFKNLKLSMLSVMTVMGLRELKHCFMLRTVFTESEQERDSETLVKARFSSAFIWNPFILIMNKFTPRYYLTGFIPLMILVCISPVQRLEACPVCGIKRLLWTGVAVLAVLPAGLLFLDAGRWPRMRGMFSFISQRMPQRLKAKSNGILLLARRDKGVKDR